MRVLGGFLQLSDAESVTFLSRDRQPHLPNSSFLRLRAQIPHQKPMRWSDTGFFSEKYRVVAVEAERLIIKGIVTGSVLTIINSDPATPLTAEQYPLGKLIALSDPSASPPH